MIYTIVPSTSRLSPGNVVQQLSVACRDGLLLSCLLLSLKGSPNPPTAGVSSAVRRASSDAAAAFYLACLFLLWDQDTHIHNHPNRFIPQNIFQRANDNGAFSYRKCVTRGDCLPGDYSLGSFKELLRLYVLAGNRCKETILWCGCEPRTFALWNRHHRLFKLLCLKQNVSFVWRYLIGFNFRMMHLHFSSKQSKENFPVAVSVPTRPSKQKRKNKSSVQDYEYKFWNQISGMRRKVTCVNRKKPEIIAFQHCMNTTNRIKVRFQRSEFDTWQKCN